MIRAATFLGLAGLALATALFAYEGVGAIFAALASAGIGIVWASLFHFVSMAINARAWQVLLPARRRGSLAFFLWVVWVREAVNGLLPVARIGGEVASARLLIRGRLRPPHAVASLVVDVTVSIVSQFFFTLLGLALLLRRGASADVIGEIELGLVAAIPLVVALLVVQRFGFFALLARLCHALFGDRF